MKISAELKGMKEAQRNMEQAVRDIRGTPMINAMRDATLYVTRDAKINAPVDSGRLRASITPDVTTMGDEITGVVGSNVMYAPYVELGTRPHWVPKGALAVWARRHNMPESAVRWAIAQRGTPAKRYLQNAFEVNRGKIEARIGQAVSGIVKAANQ